MIGNDYSLPVELFFSARNLKNLDVFSKSDPFVKLSLQKSFHGNIDLVGRTETIPNTVNPNWQSKIVVDYFFEMRQPVLVEVYDEDSSKNAELIGKVETSMGAIMGSHQQTFIADILNQQGKPAGKLIIRAEKVEQSNLDMSMRWKGVKVANVDSHFDFVDKSDPYLKFIKVRQDNTFVQAARTEVIFDNQEPKWKPLVIPAAKLLDVQAPLSSFKVECWDHEEKEHKHQFIGEAYVSSDVLKNKKCPIEFNLENPKIKKPGKLVLQAFEMQPVYNFVDFLKSGLQINLAVAIDFTGSNGVPTSPESLHYMGNQPNQYQQVIKAIWDIVENYDSDKKIPAFGFGAKPHFPNINQNTANHCFPLSDNYKNPEIQGFGNLMNVYAQALQNMEFAGPTYFAPILEQAFNAAKGLTNSYSYMVLLILTDGAIHDMAPTKQIIVRNSNLPISIIIVGVGSSDFSSMRELDGDEKGLFSPTGQKCPRDIVQFVPYSKYNGNPQLLSSELLREVPNQVSQYFKLINKAPLPPKNVNMSEIMPHH